MAETRAARSRGKAEAFHVVSLMSPGPGYWKAKYSSELDGLPVAEALGARSRGAAQPRAGTCSARPPVLSERRREACPLVKAYGEASGKREVELGESVGVDERVDLGNLSVGDGEGHD
jgi:hypothetical protein